MYWHEKFDDKAILKKSLTYLAAGLITGLLLVPTLLWIKKIPLHPLSFLSGGLMGLTVAFIIIMLLL